MKVFGIRRNLWVILMVGFLMGMAGSAQAAVLKCGTGIAFFRAYDTDDGGGDVKREIQFTVYVFTNPSKSAIATISKIVLFNTDGGINKTLGDGGDAFPADFDPVIGPKAQADLDLRDVFAVPTAPVIERVRLVAFSDKKVVGSKRRLVRGFKMGFGQQEERTRVIQSCKD